MIVVLKKIVKPQFMIVVFKDIFKTTITNCGFMVIMIKKYFKNNIKNTIPLKRGWSKNNFGPQLLTVILRKIVKLPS